jgi:hypothetical protein
MREMGDPGSDNDGVSPTPAQQARAARIAAEIADYQPWFDNQRRLRALVAELETPSQQIAGADPRWQR